MLEKIVIIAIRIAGWAMSATPTLIAEKQWNAKKNLIKGHPAKDVYKQAVSAFRRKK